MVDAMQTAQSSESFCFLTGLRGFHVYSTTKGWKPYLQEKITFKREHDNVHDRFAVSGLATLRGRLAPVVVGHIPRELSRYVWYALEKGAKFTGEVLINSKGKKISTYSRRPRDTYKSECPVDRLKKSSRFKAENREGLISHRDRLHR